MNDLQKAELYIEELTNTKNSVEALINLLEYSKGSHPQYNQLHYLKERSQEIESQLADLNKIKDKLLSEIHNG